MSRVKALNARYAAVQSLVRYGVEIVAVGDPAGARVNAAVLALLRADAEDGQGILGNLLAATKALRWRLLTQPQPAPFNTAVEESVAGVHAEVDWMFESVSTHTLLEQVRDVAAAALQSESPVGGVLLRSIEEAGPSSCVVVAASRAAK
ncbi:MAG: hypothetical protein GY953_57050, partial [bacterium]|nr:hypothetical protein [bacterium]